jgi:hypothetical protein
MVVNYRDKRGPSAATLEHHLNMAIDPPNFSLHTTFKGRIEKFSAPFLVKLRTVSSMATVPYKGTCHESHVLAPFLE